MHDVRVINELVHKQSAFVEKLNAEVAKVIVGQKAMIERIMIGLLTGGHVLLEGVPGLAKTLTVKTLADALAMKFQRIQPKSSAGKNTARRCGFGMTIMCPSANSALDTTSAAPTGAPRRRRVGGQTCSSRSSR